MNSKFRKISRTKYVGDKLEIFDGNGDSFDVNNNRFADFDYFCNIWHYKILENSLILSNSLVLKSKILVYWKRDVSFQNDKVTENVLRCSPNILRRLKNQIMESINQK